MPKTTKKAARKAGPSPVLFACTVTKADTRIGAMKCLPGAKATLTEEKARALEKLGRIRIDGIA